MARPEQDGEGEDVLGDLRTLTSLAGSPKSPHFAVVESACRPGAGTRSVLNVVASSRSGITVRRLIDGRSITSPRWHPDGAAVASIVDGHVVVHDSAGHLVQRTGPPVRGAIEGITWLDGTRHVAVVEVPGGRSALWLVDVGRRSWTSILDLPGPCIAAEASPDGRKVAAVVAEPGWPADAAPSSLHVLDLTTGRPRTFLDGFGAVQNPRWSPDGRRLAAVVRQPGPAHWSDNWRLAIASIDGGVRLAGDTETNYGRNLLGTMALAWRGTELLATAPHRGEFRLWRILPSPEVALSPTDVHVVDFAVAAGGLTATVETWPDLPPRLVVRDRLGQAIGTHEPNGGPQRRAARVQVIRLHAEHGRQAETFVLRPPWGRSARSFVVDLHGGPHGSHPNPAPAAWQLWATLTGDGHTVVLPNPRGSTSYGIDFQRAVVGDWAGADASDVLAVLDHAVHTEGRGQAAPVGIVGWSYGAYLAAWLMATTNRFAAGALGGVISDLDRFAASTDIPDYATHEFDGATAARRSPLSHIRPGMPPMLLLHAEEDRRCPVDQATALHEKLLAVGNTAELVVYPSSDHVFMSPPLVADRIRRTRTWFRSHLHL